MKTIHSISGYVLALILMMTSVQQLQAQDAFYIYRNDGDFNGFFFDEIVRMSYSKTDLEGEEHNEYVIQEIETKDSLYRIPLCAIDSIGFQQPEIKINPRVRIIEQCELKQYLYYDASGDDGIDLYFDNLPENLIPKVGDILISVPPSEPDEPIYYSHKGYSCVVDEIETNIANNNITGVHGHYVTDPGEVFEQFITVEDVTVDPEGNVRRRLAGWDPEKVRRRDPKGINLIDLDFTIGREWNPTNNSKIAIEAKLGVKFNLRATYDIGWSKFYAKLTRTLTTTVEPAVTIGYKGEFTKELDDIIELPPIIFPAACPVFGINPYPSLFLHVWGEFETKLTLPEAQLNIAEEIVFDTSWLFPVSYSLHPVPSEKKLDKPIFDVGNTSVKLAGHVQAGLKVGCDVGTTKWMQKIIRGNVGFWAYIGPQVDGQIEFKTDWLNNDEMNLYDILSRAEVDVSLISVNIEAKATARALWGEEQHKTLLTKDWKFLADTLLFVPRFNEWNPISTTYSDNGHKVTLALHPNPKKLFYLNDLSIGIYEPPSDKEDYTDRDMILVKRVGNWTYLPSASSKYEYTLTEGDISSLKGSKVYGASPMVTWLGNGPYSAFLAGGFICPCTMDLKSREIHFSADGGEASVEFTTNCLKEHIEFEGFYGRLEVIDEEKGQYRAVFRTLPNKTLWDRKIMKGAAIIFTNGGSVMDRFELDVYQAPNNLSNFEVEARGNAYGSNNSGDRESWEIDFPRHQVTATREGDNIIRVVGDYTSKKNGITIKRYISFEIQKIVETDPLTGEEYIHSQVTNGNIRNGIESGDESGSYTRGLFHWNDYDGSDLDSSTYYQVIHHDDGTVSTSTYKADSDVNMSFSRTFWIDGEEL